MVIPGKIKGDGSNELGALAEQVAPVSETHDTKKKPKRSRHQSGQCTKQKGAKPRSRQTQKKNKKVKAHDAKHVEVEDVLDIGAAKKKPKSTKAKPAESEQECKPAVWKHYPRYSIELSRSRITCRTGWLGKGQNHIIKFAVVGGLEAARAQAESWVAAEKVRQNLV